MRLRLPRCRVFNSRFLCIFLVVLAFCAVFVYYNTSPQAFRKPGNRIPNDELDLKGPAQYLHESLTVQDTEKPDQCPLLRESAADIDTVALYRHFDFQPSWMRTREFWDKTFEDRYETLHNDSRRPMLKVIVVPHSHNDPGWLRTFEQYFEWKTSNIINNIVSKLTQYQNMTFIWTEISYLSAWWERSHPVKQKALKKLIKEGRLEITTGGWVMPDEACTHIYALIDQFIEGHQWVKTNLGIMPKTGWSIDPFGHGPTVPYLLDQSGLEGTIIQRIHYAWKQWLAKRQIEEFYWIPGWSTKKPSLVVHNQPFDIYSIKSTCGPHPAICLGFDFRRIPGEYSEYTAKYEEINDHNLHRKSKTLIEEYERIGSLTPHNVALVPLGDDFRYDYESEFDAQYTNYMKMFNYINEHKELFNAEVHFGTPLDYFHALEKRQKSIPTLKGDFFVYSDIFSEGKPAYWSGYYTTRPFLKILDRQFEHELRAAEILFSLVLNRMKQTKEHSSTSSEKRLEKSYEHLITARRNLGLFQHHDAITGTSKANVMNDYGTRLFTSLYHCIRIQEAALTSVMIPDEKLHTLNVLQSEIEWETYGKPVSKLKVSYVDKKKVVLFNSLAESRREVITLRSNTSDVRVYDNYHKDYVLYQITPIIEVQANGKRVTSENEFDLQFVAKLPPLTAVTYSLEHHENKTARCTVFCNKCNEDKEKSGTFITKNMQPGDIQLENSAMQILINRNSGFMRHIYRKDIMKRNIVEIQFGAYQSAQRHSGAYLFMTDFESPEKNILNQYHNWNEDDDNIIIVSGPVSTSVTVTYLPFLVHTVTIFNVDDPALSHGVLVENVVDFENPPKNRETELFMRIQTDIQNGEPPVYYTDQNGFQYQKRVKVESLGIEANYYPITTMAWLQDDVHRLTFLTNHAQGTAAFEPGRLEVMLDRRTLYDDMRGIGEGMVDNRLTTFKNWLLLESVSPNRVKRQSEDGMRHLNERHFIPNQKESHYQLPSATADHLSRCLNYPVNVFLVDTSEVGEMTVKDHEQFVHNFPSGIHLVTMRTITDEILEQFPSASCYMVLHRPGYNCHIGKKSSNKGFKFANTVFSKVEVINVTSVSLTGLKTFKPLSGLREIELDTMEVKTYQIQF